MLRHSGSPQAGNEDGDMGAVAAIISIVRSNVHELLWLWPLAGQHYPASAGAGKWGGRGLLSVHGNGHFPFVNRGDRRYVAKPCALTPRQGID